VIILGPDLFAGSAAVAGVEYGADYYDLATFHWEQGQREKAMAIAREGLKKGKGRMDDLRAFVAKGGR
jgi:hypothetical protein